MFKEKHFSQEPTSEKRESKTEMCKVIDDRIDELLSERKKLYEKLNSINFTHCFSALLDNEIISDDIINEITEEWLNVVKSETCFLDSLDSLGIEIFKDDLTDQPNFDETILWGSDLNFEVRRPGSNLSLGGFARRGDMDDEVPTIEIATEKPDLRSQLLYLAQEGALHPTVKTYIHELIHRVHTRENSSVSSELTEAHAWFSGIIDQGVKFSLLEKVNHLASDDGYGFDREKANRALKAVSSLSAMGVSEKKIAELVIGSKYDKEEEKYLPLEAEVDSMADELGVDELDIQALEDIYKINASNQLLKARISLIEGLTKKLTREGIIESKKVHSKKNLTTLPYYEIGGSKLPGNMFSQNVIVLDNEEFPYDPIGERHGVVFGRFLNEKESKLEYNIGRTLIDSEGVVSLDMSSNSEDVEYYMNIVRENSSNINKESKAVFLNNCINIFPELGRLGEETLSNVITKKDIEEIVTFDFIEKKLSSLFLSLKSVSSNNLLQKDRSDGAETGKYLMDNIEKFLNFYNIKVADIYPQIDLMKELINRKIEALEDRDKLSH